MYNSYEEYMQSVLGFNMGNTYMPNNGFYEERRQEPSLPEVNKFYPEIYGIVYPMVQKACGDRSLSSFNEAKINEVVEEIYGVLEPVKEQGAANADTSASGAALRNGDVRNPRAKEVKEERKPSVNPLLKDLIKILVIREILGCDNRHGSLQQRQSMPAMPPVMQPGVPPVMQTPVMPAGVPSPNVQPNMPMQPMYGYVPYGL